MRPARRRRRRACGRSARRRQAGAGGQPDAVPLVAQIGAFGCALRSALGGGARRGAAAAAAGGRRRVGLRPVSAPATAAPLGDDRRRSRERHRRGRRAPAAPAREGRSQQCRRRRRQQGWLVAARQPPASAAAPILRQAERDPAPRPAAAQCRALVAHVGRNGWACSPEHAAARSRSASARGAGRRGCRASLSSSRAVAPTRRYPGQRGGGQRRRWQARTSTAAACAAACRQPLETRQQPTGNGEPRRTK